MIADPQTIADENKKNPHEELIDLVDYPDSLRTAADSVKTLPERITERVENHYAEATGNDISGNHHLRRTRSRGWALNIGVSPDY